MSQIVTRVLITGANGFIGKNLQVRLSELPGLMVSTFMRGDDAAKLPALGQRVGFRPPSAPPRRPVPPVRATWPRRRRA